MKKKIICILLTLVMLIGMTSISAFAEGSPVSYLDANGTLKTANNVTEIDTPQDTLSEGWYLLKGNMEFTNGLTLSGSVNLILADGAMINVTNSILLSDQNTDLTIYAQSTGESMGTLIANGKVSSAGIGSGENGSCGAITINGGNITAQGGAYSAGIGSGENGSCGAITINGGNIEATGDDAGIGSGLNGSCGSITINGGNITAQGNKGAAGIGSGLGASCGAITINGGNIKATGSGNAAGIGSGSGRTSGWEASCVAITISGGNITAQGGYCNPAIGSGSWFSVCGDIIISGGIVTASAGDKSVAIGSGELNSECGDITISGDYVRAKGAEGFAHIGAGRNSSCGNIDYTSCKHWEEDGWYYVTNHELTSAVQVNCEEAGYREYYKYLFDNKYYAALPFSDATCIGDETALAAWLSEGGNGYIAPLGHKDDNADKVCDNCGQIYYSYYDYNPATGQMSEKYRFAPAINSKTSTLTDGWYAVKGNVEITGSLTINGDVHLILANGSGLTVKQGIHLTKGNKLTIYAQTLDSYSNNVGKLTAVGCDDDYAPSAGIGGYYITDSQRFACGRLTINGGKITATGGPFSAGIGGSDGAGCDDITINGGFVTATGGTWGTGIGGGFGGYLTKLTINGGTVTARGDDVGAGIGGGGQIEINNNAYVLIYGGENSVAFGNGKDGSPAAVRLGSGLAAYEIVDLYTTSGRIKETIYPEKPLPVNDDGTVAVGTCRRVNVQTKIANDGPIDPTQFTPITPIIPINPQLRFTDVDVNAYYADAVSWAAENGITNGTSATTFEPLVAVNRAQVVTFLWRAAGCPEPTSMSSFSDVSADAYYAKAVAWAVENGITDGVGNGKFAPDQVCTRGQIVTFLWRYAGSPVVDYRMQMEDVPSGQYYTEAVRWALFEKVTDGTSETTFSPNDNCTRAQVVTFLYRWIVK